MDLKDFAKIPIDYKELEDENVKQEKTINNENVMDYQGLAEEFLKKYGSMDESQLLDEMLKLIKKQKQEGKFDAEQIKKAAMQIAPLLNDEQRAKMLNLLNYLS